MSEPQRTVLLSTYLDLEQQMQAYRTTLLWLTHGNHQEHRPTEQETRHQLEVLQDMMIGLFNSIASQLRQP